MGTYLTMFYKTPVTLGVRQTKSYLLTRSAMLQVATRLMKFYGLYSKDVLGQLMINVEQDDLFTAN